MVEVVVPTATFSVEVVAETSVVATAWVELTTAEEAMPVELTTALEATSEVATALLMVEVWTVVCVSVTGQRVVETTEVRVVVSTVPLRPGQLVTVPAQLVMVDTTVVRTVDVLKKLVTTVLVTSVVWTTAAGGVETSVALVALVTTEPVSVEAVSVELTEPVSTTLVALVATEPVSVELTDPVSTEEVSTEEVSTEEMAEVVETSSAGGVVKDSVAVVLTEALLATELVWIALVEEAVAEEEPRVLVRTVPVAVVKVDLVLLLLGGLVEVGGLVEEEPHSKEMVETMTLQVGLGLDGWEG